MIFSALLEVAGLGLIIQTLYLMSEPNYLNSYPGNHKLFKKSNLKTLSWNKG